jgi:membrane-bound lytic murein transglycosylase D
MHSIFNLKRFIVISLLLSGCATAPKKQEDLLSRWTTKTAQERLGQWEDGKAQQISPVSPAAEAAEDEAVQESQTDQIDVAHQVNPDESQYTEEDKSEDVIEKLIQEDTPKGGMDRKTVERKFIPIRLIPSVKKWIQFFTVRDRARFQRFIDNGAKYQEDIAAILEEQGMPQELFFVGLIESGYYLRARSKASAVGPWQFIRATGKRYGLTVGKFIDERNDIIKATYAAARYFRDLYNIFGSWELSLSAYNAGEYGILRRMRRANTRNFYELAQSGYLHKETANYVPKVIAAMYIYKNADEFGFNIPHIPSKLKDTVKIPLKHAHEIKALGEALAMTEEEIFSYNSELMTDFTPYIPGKYYELRIPKSVYENSFKTILALKNAPGIFSNARSARKLASANRVKNDKVESQILKWGQSSVKKGKKVIVENKNIGQILRVDGPIIYQVREGDNLTQISELFRRSQAQIKKTNRLKSGQVMVGQKLIIPSTHKQYYKVQRGDNLTDVARKLKTQVSVLMALNKLKNQGQIMPGQKLLFFAL